MNGGVKIENNKITVKQILDMATKYQFSDWRLEGARTGKSICQSNYRSSVVNEYYEKIVASIYTEIFTQNIVNHATSRLVITVSGE
jgi:hypothetical protein